MVLAYSGSILAGVGFSLLCTSQSVFYQQTSSMYASKRNLSTEAVNDTFGGVFTMIYVPLEMIMKQVRLIYLAHILANLLCIPHAPFFSFFFLQSKLLI
jgi:hypothetical protein